MLVAVWFGRLAALPYTDLAAEDAAAARRIAELWRLAVWLVLPLGWVIFVERLDPRRAIDQRPGTHAALGWLAAAAATLAARALEVHLGKDWIAVPSVPGSVLFVATVGLMFAALCEELVFRGLVLKALRARLAFWPANILAASLHAGMLALGWTAMVEFDVGGLAYLFASVVLFGVLLGWLVRLTGTVWVAVAAHFLNDFLQGFGFPA